MLIAYSPIALHLILHISFVSFSIYLYNLNLFGLFRLLFFKISEELIWFATFLLGISYQGMENINNQFFSKAFILNRIDLYVLSVARAAWNLICTKELL